MVKSLAGSAAALVALTGIVAGTPAPSVLVASEPSTLVLNLHFTSFAGLSPYTNATLKAEAESIWKRGHVRLKWLRESTEAEGDVTLRVLVMARPAPRANESSPWAVAELVRLGGSRATAIASTIGAKRIVDEGRRELLQEPAGLEDYRMGLVLGRAVSHEIGHYLLQTNTHATRGLMRAQIDSREFADLRSGSFRLDQAAEAHMATLAAKGPLSFQTMTSFSYVAR